MVLQGSTVFKFNNDLKSKLSRNLGNNKFPYLPENGLQSVRHLKVHNIPELREIPPPESFPKVHTLALSYAYHCCQFLPEAPPFGGVEVATESTFLDQLQESWYIPEKGDKFDESLWSMNMSDFWPGFYGEKYSDSNLLCF
jgi:leucine-rich repeat-containing G protein-coupled receptor 6